jgi:hypothetical protein
MPRKRSYNIDDVPSGVKMVELYGSFTKEVNQLERVLRTRSDGVKQHYWVKTGKREFKLFSGRIGFYGPGHELGQAIANTMNIVPKKNYQIIPAREFNKNPYKFGTYGVWVLKNVES